MQTRTIMRAVGRLIISKWIKVMMMAMAVATALSWFPRTAVFTLLIREIPYKITADRTALRI